MRQIPITKPLLGDAELEAVREPIESGWVVQGPRVLEFESRFASFSGSPYAAATSSCTTALHIALAALGVGPGDEVIVPAFTWISTANVVEYLGGTPVFCDVDLETYNIDVTRCEELVTPRTVGIIPVHLFGLAAEIEAVLELAERKGLWVVEDAACGFGCRRRGRHVGTFGAFGAFSFHPRKAITTGEGGMLTTADPELDRLVRSLRDHGASRSDRERHGESGAFLLAEYPYLGFNFRLTDIQGALGCAQMERADWILEQRRRLATRYEELLADVDWLRTPVVPDGDAHGYQAYVCLFASEEPSLDNVTELHERRNRLMQALEERGIATRQGTHAVVSTQYYMERYDLVPEQFPAASLAERLTLTLPLYPQMTEEEQDFVVSALHQVPELVR